MTRRGGLPEITLPERLRSTPVYLRRFYCSVCGKTRLFELADTKWSTEQAALRMLKEECPNHGN